MHVRACWFWSVESNTFFFLSRTPVLKPTLCFFAERVRLHTQAPSSSVHITLLYVSLMLVSDSASFRPKSRLSTSLCLDNLVATPFPTHSIVHLHYPLSRRYHCTHALVTINTDDNHAIQLSHVAVEPFCLPCGPSKRRDRHLPPSVSVSPTIRHTPRSPISASGQPSSLPHPSLMHTPLLHLSARF